MGWPSSSITKDVIAFRLPTSGRDRPWQFRQRGNEIELRPQFRTRINETDGLLQGLLLGLGICQVPDYLVEPALADGRLVQLLPTFRPRPTPISIVYPSERLMPSRVRAAVKALEGLRTTA